MEEKSRVGRGPRKVPSHTGGVALLQLGRVALGTTVSSGGVALLGLGRVAFRTAVSSGSRDSEPLLMSFRVSEETIFRFGARKTAFRIKISPL